MDDASECAYVFDEVRAAGLLGVMVPYRTLDHG